MAQCPEQRGVRPATGRYRENAATGNRAPDAEKSGAEGAENATSGSSPAVNVSGWALLARWRQPQLLLLDEPFGALDAFTRDQMQTLLLKLWQETGKQVLLITHDIEEAVFMTELFCFHSGPSPRKLGAAAAHPLLAASLRVSRAAASSPIHTHRHARICFAAYLSSGGVS